MRWFTLPLMLLLFASMAFAQTADQIFERFQTTYQQHENFSAEFEQTSYQQTYKSVAQGKVFFAKLNLLRMEYVDKDNPKQLMQLILLDGKHAWSYTPVLNQVNKSVQTQQGGGSGILPGLGTSFEYLREHYNLTLVEDEVAAKKGVHHLSLALKNTPTDAKEIIEVWIRNTDWLPIQFSYQLTNSGGDNFSSITSLKHIKVNQALPEDTFRFVIPEGAEVVNVTPSEG